MARSSSPSLTVFSWRCIQPSAEVIDLFFSLTTPTLLSLYFACCGQMFQVLFPHHVTKVLYVAWPCQILLQKALCVPALLKTSSLMTLLAYNGFCIFPRKSVEVLSLSSTSGFGQYSCPALCLVLNERRLFARSVLRSEKAFFAWATFDLNLLVDFSVWAHQCSKVF